MTKKKRIVFFTYFPLYYGGGTVNFYNIASVGLKKRYPNLSIHIITGNDSVAHKILSLYSFYFQGKYDKNLYNKEKKQLVIEKLHRVTYTQVGSIGQLKEKLQKSDIIYTKNDFIEAFLFSMLLGYRSLPPIIYGFHTPLVYERTSSLQSKLHNIMYSSFLYKRFISGAHAFHVLNSYDFTLLKSWFPKKNIVKIYNPFNWELFSSNITKKQRKKENNLSVLWIGRLTEQKGIGDLISIIESLNGSSAGKSISWTIVGEGELRSQVIDLAKKYTNVTYRGFVPNDQVADIYKQHDLFLMTSQWESFPYTILEAQSLGLFVICFDIHGVEEMVENGITGLRVHTREEMRKTILRCITHPPFNRSDIIRISRKKFDQEYSYTSLYSLLTNNDNTLQ